MTGVYKEYKCQLGGKLGFIICYLNWRHQTKLAESSFKVTMVKTTMHYGPSGKKCWSSGVLAAGCCKCPGAQSASQKISLQGTMTYRYSSSCPEGFSGENFWVTGKYPKTSHCYILISFETLSVTSY